MSNGEKKEQRQSQDFDIRKVDGSYVRANSSEVFEAWKRVWEESGWGEEETHTLDDVEYITNLADKGTAYLVEDRGQIVGFAIATVGHFPEPKSEKEKQIYEDAKQALERPAYFHELAIVPGARGLGLGGKLMGMLEEKAKEQGADGAFLWTRKESRRQKLYRRLGFELVGEETVPKDNKVGKEDRVYFLKHFKVSVK